MPAIPFSALSQAATLPLQEGKFINLTARIDRNNVSMYLHCIQYRLEPVQLERARQAFQEELALAPQPREDSVSETPQEGPPQE